MGCFEEQKGIKYTWDNVYFDIIVFSSLRSTKPCIRFLFICFAREIKGVHQSSLGNDVDFRDRMNITPNIVAKIKISKSETGFCRWKSTANKDINIFKSLRNPGIFLLAKEKPWKRIFNTTSELSQNCTEKQIMPFKTAINRLFSDKWFYLFIACFEWKLAFFNKQW